MDSATQELHLQKIGELVYDEDKIITCTLLAQDLNISLQDAKTLLTKFVEDQSHSKLKELTATYILNGILKESKDDSVCLVKDHDLKSRRLDFEKINNEILYSIQKSNSVDFNIIALVEKVENDKPREKCLTGSVVSKNCVKRTLKVKKIPSPQQKPPVKQKPSFFTKIEPKSENGSVSNSQISKEPPNKHKQEPKAKPKGGLANFLAKGSQKSNENNVKSTFKTNDSKEKDEKIEEVHSKINNISLDDIEMKECNSLAKEEEVEEKMEVDGDSDKESTPVKKKTNVDAKKKNKKKRPNKENSEQVAKKRKRIVQRDDSESDDMFGEDEDNYEDVIEKSITEEAPTSPPQKPLAPKNKIRKAIDKTYEDEEGYIVTRTEYIYETASEDEVEVIKVPEKPTPKASPMERKASSTSENDTSPKKNTAKGKKGKKAALINQPSIMSFFKKK